MISSVSFGTANTLSLDVCVNISAFTGVVDVLCLSIGNCRPSGFLAESSSGSSFIRMALVGLDFENGLSSTEEFIPSQYVSSF